MGYMDKQNARVTEVSRQALPELGEKMFRKLKVQYKEGGTSYWDYSQQPRGFYIISHIVKIEGNMETWQTGQKGDGYIFIEEAKRFNAKRLQSLVDNARKFSEELHTMLGNPIPGSIDYIKRVVTTGSE